MIRTVCATRYVTALREGGSLPAIVEADDSGLYVLKFRGAGQGPLALVAELIVGELGRGLNLPVPEVVLVDVDSALGRNEPDEEIRDLLQASVGLNVAMDYLPGSAMFDPAAGDSSDGALASKVVWFDAFATNVDRTANNPNLLLWHKKLYMIDHGAALYFQHSWDSFDKVAASRFAAIKKHVLLPWATSLQDADNELRPQLTDELFTSVLADVPDEWLPEAAGLDATTRRAAYVTYLQRRLEAAPQFLEEALRARAELV